MPWFLILVAAVIAAARGWVFNVQRATAFAVLVVSIYLAALALGFR